MQREVPKTHDKAMEDLYQKVEAKLEEITHKGTVADPELEEARQRNNAADGFMEWLGCFSPY